MQRPTAETIREQCMAIAAVADPSDSQRRLALRLEGVLSSRQVRRRIEAMERDLGLPPARGAETGGGRPPAGGGEPQHVSAYRRSGEVALRWRRRHSL